MIFWILANISAIAWGAFAVGKGIRDKLNPIPIAGTIAIFAWDVSATTGFLTSWGIQHYLEPVWVVQELGLLYLFARYGPKDYPEIPRRVLYTAVGAALAAAAPAAYLLRPVMNDPMSMYWAFMITIMIPGLQLPLLYRRGSTAGQSLAGAISLLVCSVTVSTALLKYSPFPLDRPLLGYLSALYILTCAAHVAVLARMRRREIHAAAVAVHVAPVR
ncbi:transmembrane-type terpene cyclase [Kitasatospora sp. NPDC001574]